MRNQHSFRITKELRPSDMKVSVSKVLNKVDEDGKSFFPNYERPITVALQSADGKVFETTKATADGAGILNFEIRGLPDDSSLDGVEAFRKHWNPGTICIVTMASQDLIGLGSDNNRTGENTYHEDAKFKKDVEIEGDLKVEKPIEAQGGVKIPEFDSVEDATTAITDPYAGMQIVIQGEIYKRNNMYERWEVLAQGEPVPLASKVIPGSVMLANEEDMSEGRDERDGKPVVVQPSGLSVSSLTEKIFPLGEDAEKNDVLYLKQADMKLYKASASSDATLPSDGTIRIAQENGSTDDVIKVSYLGKHIGFIGLDHGKDYFIQNIAGTIGKNQGTKPYRAGISVGDSALFLGTKKTPVLLSTTPIYGNNTVIPPIGTDFIVIKATTSGSNANKRFNSGVLYFGGNIGLNTHGNSNMFVTYSWGSDGVSISGNNGVSWFSYYSN